MPSGEQHAVDPQPWTGERVSARPIMNPQHRSHGMGEQKSPLRPFSYASKALGTRFPAAAISTFVDSSPPPNATNTGPSKARLGCSRIT